MATNGFLALEEKYVLRSKRHQKIQDKPGQKHRVKSDKGFKGVQMSYTVHMLSILLSRMCLIVPPPIKDMVKQRSNS